MQTGFFTFIAENLNSWNRRSMQIWSYITSVSFWQMKLQKKIVSVIESLVINTGLDVDISTALKLVRKYFIQNEARSCIDIIKLITRYVHAVKTEFRQFSRPLRGIGAIHFGYRWHILTEYYFATDKKHLSFCRALISELSAINSNSHWLIYQRLWSEQFIEHSA